ncbi:MAG TPA: peptidylprolyl isomerase [Saprospiraceae bacterium]|nr:peptidylprolyl isomerase [Saprospiraceae bacterium]
MNKNKYSNFINLQQINTTLKMFGSKKHWVVILCSIHISLLYGQNNNEILMRVGSIPVSVEEFKYIYEKNNGKDATYSPSSINEYIELYSRFKLKVNEAKTQKIDTIESLKEELNGYKRQLSNSYLMEKGVRDFLIEDLKAKITKDIKLAHIYLPIPNFATDSVKTSIEQRINEAHDALVKGKSFENAAMEYSEDKNSKDIGGNIGYYTAMMPNGFYQFENTMYSTAVNQFSKPVKSRLGWHILKVLDIRPARGQIQVAHILVRTKDNPDAKKNIDRAFADLNSGKNWGAIVSQYSQDTETASYDGVLPVFGINNYEKSFEDVAFNLTKIDEYSAPFQTTAGWHIVKLVQKLPITIDDNFQKLYEPKIKNDERWQLARIEFLKSIRQAANFSINAPLLESFIRSLNGDFLSYRWSPSAEPNDKATLISLGSPYNFTLEEFKDFAQKNSRIRLRFDNINHTAKDAVDAVLDAFIEEKTIEFEQNNMENKYPEFKALLREYEEGILLFEVTKNEIWDRANQDSIGLNNFYLANKNRYLSEEKALVKQVVIKNSDEKIATKILLEAAKKDLAGIVKKYNKKTKVIETNDTFLTKSEALKSGLDWKKGSVNAMEKNIGIEAYIFSKIEQLIPAAPKELKETRGYVVADYQDTLEKEWIEKLKSKYPIEINQNILKKLYR